MGQDGREWIPVRVSGVVGRKEGDQSLLRRERCRDTGGEAKLDPFWARVGRRVEVKQLREMRLSELWLCSVASVVERPEEKRDTGLWRVWERSGETRDSSRSVLTGKE